MKNQLIIATSTLSLVLLSGFSSIAKADIFPGGSMKDIFTPPKSVPEAIFKGASAGAATGEAIEKYTGAGSKAGDYIYQNSNRKTAGEAVDKFDNASDSWKKGNYGDAMGNGAQGIGKMFKGYINW
jgi:hypothetical protein